MKKILYSSLAIAVLGFTGCNKTSEKKEETTIEKTETAANGGKSYGAKITEEGAIPAAELKSKMAEQDSLQVKISGEIDEVCQNKGCWVTINMPNGEPMRVKFGEDVFFVPKDVSGKLAIVEGTAKKEIISVDEQRHYLQDAGKPKAEIEAITTPDTTLSFIATGIIIK
jgi:hypothetical protein